MDVLVLALAILGPIVLLVLGIALIVHLRERRRTGRRRGSRFPGYDTSNSLNHML